MGPLQGEVITCLQLRKALLPGKHEGQKGKVVQEFLARVIKEV